MCIALPKNIYVALHVRYIYVHIYLNKIVCCMLMGYFKIGCKTNVRTKTILCSMSHCRICILYMLNESFFPRVFDLLFWTRPEGFNFTSNFSLTSFCNAIRSVGKSSNCDDDTTNSITTIFKLGIIHNVCSDEEGGVWSKQNSIFKCFKVSCIMFGRRGTWDPSSKQLDSELF